MNSVRRINEDYCYVGASERSPRLFENLFPVPRGVSYNSYLLRDEKTVLFDTVDRAVGDAFFENLSAALGGRKLDYAVVSHMEPDHAATLAELVLRYPGVKLVCNAKSANMIRQFFDFDFDPLLVAEGEELSVGEHTLKFIMAPMVHWPEVMFTFDERDGILFSADAFGAFGALEGSIFADELDIASEWQDDYLRYYSNIVGKYGAQVQAALKKTAGLDIRMICPLHGPVWRGELTRLLEKYDRWSKWEPETDDVLIVYSTVYGNTERAVAQAAAYLAERGRRVRTINICTTDRSYTVAEMFRAKNILLATTTYNNGIYPAMEYLLDDIAALTLRDRRVGIIENGTWAPAAAKLISAKLDTMKNIEVAGVLTVKSALKPEQEAQLQELCDALIS